MKFFILRLLSVSRGYLKVRFAELLFTLSSGEPGCTMECLTLRPQLGSRAGNMVGVEGEGCV